MTCLRCQGFMRVEPVLRRRQATLLLWACFTCGDRIDDVILLQRRCARPETVEARNDRIWREAQRLASVSLDRGAA